MSERPVSNDWRRQASCLDHDPELFFPVGTGGHAARQIQEARAICQGCPVRDACLEWAMQEAPEFGVWGGLSEEERRRLRGRQRRRSPVAIDQDANRELLSQRAASRRRTLNVAKALERELSNNVKTKFPVRRKRSAC